MSYGLTLRPEAAADLFSARGWYEEQRQGLGLEFVVEVNHILDYVSRSPESCAVVYKSVRRAVVRRFPYVVYYRLVANVVEVIAVLHGKRHQRHWQSRLH